tara:strand:+ start:1258 stop:1458 length:201 start_codon:yes stop_codon:yes gene_type:complete
MSKKEELVEPKVETQQEVNALIIDMKLAEALVGYLKTKPMVEVEALVNAIAQSPGVVVNKEQEPKK